VRNWQGIRQDTDATASDGAFLAINPTYDIEGEIARRPGMELFEEQTGNSMLVFWCATGGYQVAFATTAGELVVLEATS
jgi:hypothetical protein